MKEKGLHINCKELLAVYYSLESFKTYCQNKHVRIFSDSQVEVQTMNKTGTTKKFRMQWFCQERLALLCQK